MKSETYNALVAMICSICWAKQSDPRFLPPDYHPGSSFFWLMLGLAVIDFVLIAIPLYLAARAEERKMREAEHSENSKDKDSANAVSEESTPARKKLGADCDEIWISDDFDAPMILVDDRPTERRKKR